ncbi:hypothetical protein BDV59DRAFT_171346 [Aspergillus ambiguus]|uniref:uncharacterized protein n=1 Tax=Aspergillus ambiguus TaxID=176160 RepID=UPI003CCD4215
MDQAHTRAMEALQPFIHLAISSNAPSPKFLSNIIANATSSPNTYVFAELLETPAIQSLRSTDTPAEFQAYLTLLEIFAWGTWKDYQSTPNLPQLTQEQALKLRLLSLLSLAATTKPLTYETLMSALSIAAPSELESLVTTAIYASLITARLSPASNPPTVNVTAVAPLRDVKPQSLPTMIAILTHWESSCGSVIADIETEIATIKATAAKRRAHENARSVLFQKSLAEVSTTPGPETLGASKLYGPGAAAAGAGGWQRGLGGNKREFNSDDFDDGDDGYWDNGADGGLDLRMDIDDGTRPSRHAKRVLGKKT